MLIQYGLNTHKRNGKLPRVVRSVVGTLLHPQTRNSSLGLPSKISTQELGRRNKKSLLAKLKTFFNFSDAQILQTVTSGSAASFLPFSCYFRFYLQFAKIR